MHARFLALAFISSLGTACLIPVDVTPDDGGRGGGGGSGGGGGAGCAPLDFSGTPSGSIAVIPLGSCRTARVFAPDGSIEPILSTGTEATFVPQQPGVYMVEVTEGGVTTRVPFPVDGAPAGGQRRRYVDTIRRCGIMRFTARETLLCVVMPGGQRNGTVYAYDSDGEFKSQFDIAVSNELEVIGDEIWTFGPDVVEHRTDTDAGLRLDGQFPAVGYRQLVDPLPGRVAVTSSVEDNSAFEVTWNGTTLDAGLRFDDLYPNPYWYPLLLSEGTLWTTDFCRLEPGCQTMACGRLRLCDGSGRIIRASTGPNVWVNTGSRLQFMTRTLSPAALSVERAMPPDMGFGLFGSRLGRGPYLRSNEGAWSVPILQNGSFFYATANDVAAVNDHFYVEVVDDFTLRFVRY